MPRDEEVSSINLTELAKLLTQAVVSSPVVVEAPKNTTPSAPVVQAVVTQVANAVAPIVAPTVPRQAIAALATEITNEVVSNPQIKAADVNVVIPPKVVNTIATNAIDRIKELDLLATQNAQANADAIKALQALETTTPTAAVTPTATTATKTVSTADVRAADIASYEAAKKAGLSADIASIDPAVAKKIVEASSVANMSPEDWNSLTQEEKIAAVKSDREVSQEIAVGERTKSDPKFNFNLRPDAPKPDDNYIYYYSWVGDDISGEWKLYRAPNTTENMRAYGSRSIGGATQASQTGDINGANALINQPVVDDKGNITLTSTSGATSGTVTSGATTGTVTGGATTGTVTGGATTGTVTGGTKTGTVTSGATTGTVTSGATSGTVTSGTTSGTVTSGTTTGTTTSATTTGTDYANRQSIITVLQDRFAKYGLSSLSQKIIDLAQNGATEATITIQLQETPEYQIRFAANADRLKKGLAVLSPAEYINLEDGYRQILRAYGLTQFDNDAYVKQFISNDVSAAELSTRVATAVQRIQNADPAVINTLRDYYGISNNDMVGYVLDPNQQLQKIQRQVAAAEIGTVARRQGIEPGVSTAEQLAAQGVSMAEAQKGYATIADILPTSEKLSQIYSSTAQGYGLAEAEQEIFNSLASAQKRRERLAALEVASFSGQTGMSRTSLAKQTQGQF